MNIKTIALLITAISTNAVAFEVKVGGSVATVEKASIMAREYKGNEYTALKKYQGKDLMIVGKVGKVSVSSITGKPTVMLTTGLMQGVMIDGSSLTDQMLSNLKKNQIVMVGCASAKLTSTIFLHIRGCDIVMPLNSKTKGKVYNMLAKDNGNKAAQIKAALSL